MPDAYLFIIQKSASRQSLGQLHLAKKFGARLVGVASRLIQHVYLGL